MMDETREPELVIDGGRPVAQQLEDQIRRYILDGVLCRGEELPTVRAVAVGLAVNPHAVEEAYEHLRREGLLIVGEGSGPRVAEQTVISALQLENMCRDFLRRATAEGHSVADVVRALHACLERGLQHGESS